MKNNIKKTPVKFWDVLLYFQHFMLIFVCPKSVIITTLNYFLTFTFSVACSVIFSQYLNLHNSYVNRLIDSFNCKLDASSVLMEYCPESCIWKIKNLCFNGAWNSMSIYGFWLVNARLLKAFGTAFYAIILINITDEQFLFTPSLSVQG